MKNFTSLYGPLEALKQKGRDWTHQILLLSRTPINHSTTPQSSSFKGKSILTKLLLQVRERKREKNTLGTISSKYLLIGSKDTFGDVHAHIRQTCSGPFSGIWVSIC